MLKKIRNIIFGIVVVLFLVAAFFHTQYEPVRESDWGMNYSQKRAEELGLHPMQTYIDMLADLKPKKIRIVAYWDRIEPERGKFQFGEVDEMLDLADKFGAEVILVIGKKQPRWPECHEPGWSLELSKEDQETVRFNMIKESVNHFKDAPALKIWQVENEPLFSFGDNCPKIDREILRQEIALVKSLDSRPVLVTDSGELGRWIPTATLGADLFGSTMYKVVHNDITGYFKYPVFPEVFRIKAGILRTFTDTDSIMGVELQGEPWLIKGVLGTPLEDQKMLMNPKVFEEYTGFAKDVGFTDNYIWGVEWWAWLAQKHGDWGMWVAAKNLLENAE